MIWILFQTEVFLSTPSVWRATDKGVQYGRDHAISIHALRVEGDLPHKNAEVIKLVISIHALRVEGDVH